MTKREFLESVVTLTNDVENATETNEFAKNELAKMDRANEKRRNTPSKAAQVNEKLLVEVMELLDGSEPMTAAQIGEALGITHYKATAVCYPAAKNGTLAVTKVKSTAKSGGKINAYSLPTPTADETVSD